VSSNAIAWTQVPFVTSNTLRSIAGNSLWRSNGLPQFLAVGDSGAAVSSVDSVTWTSQSTGNTNNLRSISFPGASFVMVGDNGTVLRYFGGAYTLRDAGATNYLQAVAFGNS